MTRQTDPADGGTILDPHGMAAFEEMLKSIIYQQQALVRLLEREGILTKKVLAEEIRIMRSLAEDQEGPG